MWQYALSMFERKPAWRVCPTIVLGSAWAMVPYVGWSVKASRLCIYISKCVVLLKWLTLPCFFKPIYPLGAWLFSCEACRNVPLQGREALSATEHSRSLQSSHTLSISRQDKAWLHRVRHSKDIAEHLFTGSRLHISPLKGKCWEPRGALRFVRCRSLHQRACGSGYWGQSRCLGVDVRLCNWRLCRL